MALMVKGLFRCLWAELTGVAVKKEARRPKNNLGLWVIVNKRLLRNFYPLLLDISLGFCC